MKTPDLTPQKVQEVREAIKQEIQGYKGSYLAFDVALAAKLGVTKEQIRHQRSTHLRMIKTSRSTPKKTLAKIQAVAHWVRDNEFKVTNKEIEAYSRKHFGQGMREGPIKRAIEKARRMQTTTAHDRPGRDMVPTAAGQRTEIYSVMEVAKKCGITDEAVRDAMRRKRLVADKTVAKIPLFYEETIAAWRRSVETYKETGGKRVVIDSVVVKKLDEILSLLRAR